MLPTAENYFHAQKAALAIDHVMVDELKLQPPSRYLLVEDGAMTWLLAVMDVQNLHGRIGKYTSEDLRHQLSTAVNGLPVALSNHSGLRYAVLLSGRPQLPRKIMFPGMPSERDVIPFGIGLRGAVNIHASKVINLIIGGSQDSGKSAALKLLAHVNRLHGAKLYLADPGGWHTFNPDLWNSLAALPVASSRQELLALLERLQAEIEERSVLFRQAATQGIPPENIDAYNDVAEEALPRIWFIGDEMNTHLGDRVVQERMADLARVGRKWGVHIALAAHTWRDADIPRGLSALFPSRLCLKVADDTSGRVTLNDVRWGRQPLKFRLQGRAILLANGMYQKLQLYWIPLEQQREWMDPVSEPMSPLTDVEKNIVAYAVDHGGEFKYREIAANVEQTSEWQVRKLGESWALRGWLERGKDATSPRRVTQKLADLAGIPLTGSHASQGITGVSQASQGPLTGLTGA